MKHINPSNKLVSKQSVMGQSSIDHNMSSSIVSSSNAQHPEEDVSSSHVDTDKPNKMSINPSLTAKRQHDEEFKAKAAAPFEKIEKPNLPRVSSKVHKQQIVAHHPGAIRNSFTNQMNVSIGSMSDSLHNRFQMKKAAAGSLNNRNH